ncbi:MAG: SDR family oxidoreductase [Verrucomicrobiota bacterium]
MGHFDELIEAAVGRSPGRRLVDIAEVGRVVSFLVSGAASGMTGDTIYVDAGLHNIA